MKSARSAVALGYITFDVFDIMQFGNKTSACASANLRHLYSSNNNTRL